MELQEAIKTRFSERKYLQEEVPNEYIAQILEAGRHAPNSCNLQVGQYIVITEEALRTRLSKIATSKMLWAPINIVMIIDSRVTLKHQSAVMSLGASMQNMILTAHELGLATCPMAGFSNDDKVKEILNIPRHFDVVLLLGLGYPEQQSEKARERVALTDSVHWNNFSGDRGLVNVSTDSRNWSWEEILNYRRRIAPVYRYNNRFSLGTYLPDIYSQLVKIFNSFATKNGLDGKKLLDIFTYDGMFIKELCAQNSSELDLTISDIVEYILHQKSDFEQEVATLQLEPEKLPQQLGYDIISLVHKLQFMPTYQTFLIDLVKSIKSGGFLFVAFDTQTNITRFFKEARLRTLAFIKGEKYNVYENNPYYKVGPYAPVSTAKVNQILKNNNFDLIQSGVVDSVSRKKSNQSYYAFYRKQ